MAYFSPRVYQHLIRAFIIKHKRCNIFASMGLGKTSASVETFDTLRLLGEVRRCIIFAPKRVARSSWPNEIQKWRESFGHLKIEAAIGTEAERIAALKSGADIITINYDNIVWLMDYYSTREWPFDMVIADESTRLKGLRISIQRRRKKDGTMGVEFITGQGAKRAKALAKMAHKPVLKYWVNLTGSPAPNGLVDVWGQHWFIDPGALGNSFSAFTDRWFRHVPGSATEQSRMELMPYSKEEIERVLAKRSLTIDVRDYFDIKEPIESIQWVDLPYKARQHYREMQKDLFTWIEHNPVEAVNTGVKYGKCLQIANGSVYVDRQKNWEPVHDVKLDALESIVEETNGAVLLVAYHYPPDAERIMTRFPFARMLGNKLQTEEDFRQGKIRMLLVNPAGAGHGLDLQHSCNHLVDYTSTANAELDEQIIERIGPTRQWQIGKKDTPVFRIRIIARGTLEETSILPCLKEKISLQDSLKRAMKTA